MYEIETYRQHLHHEPVAIDTFQKIHRFNHSVPWKSTELNYILFDQGY